MTGLMVRRATARVLLMAAVTLVALLGSATQARSPVAAPLLWQGRLGAHEVALLGTIHVPDARVLSLAPQVQTALDRADRVVTEIPLDAAQQAALASALLLPEGQHLRALIGEPLFGRLERRVRDAVAPTAPHVAPLVGAMLDRLKPWAAMAQLATLEYLPDLLAGRTSLDAQLYAEATAAGKKVGGLETVAEQAGTFDAFSLQEQIALLDDALGELDAPRGPSSAMIVQWYLEGDVAQLAAALTQGVTDAALARKFTSELLVKRNHRMADRIEALRRSEPDERLFVAVGALHLVGPDNLPQLLQARGYEISRVRP